MFGGGHPIKDQISPCLALLVAPYVDRVVGRKSTHEGGISGYFLRHSSPLTLYPPLSYLGCIGPVVYWRLQAPAESSLGVAAAQQLPDLARQSAHVGFGNLGLRGVQGRGVKVEARVLGQGVNVDCAPGIAERGARVLLDDGHGCGGGGGQGRGGAASVFFSRYIVRCPVRGKAEIAGRVEDDDDRQWKLW